MRKTGLNFGTKAANISGSNNAANNNSGSSHNVSGHSSGLASVTADQSDGNLITFLLAFLLGNIKFLNHITRSQVPSPESLTIRQARATEACSPALVSLKTVAAHRPGRFLPSLTLGRPATIAGLDYRILMPSP